MSLKALWPSQTPPVMVTVYLEMGFIGYTVIETPPGIEAPPGPIHEYPVAPMAFTAVKVVDVPQVTVLKVAETLNVHCAIPINPEIVSVIANSNPANLLVGIAMVNFAFIF